jgi:hypothetical protein
VTVGYVVTTGTQGAIFVTVRRGLTVNELDNVLATGPTDGQVLAFNATNGRYQLASPPLGPTGPAGPASTVPGPTGPTGPTGPAGVGVQYFETTVDVYDWTEGGGVFVAVLPLTGLLDTDRPLVTLDLSGVSIFDVQDVAVEFQTVYRVEASDDDELTLYATAIPSVDFDLLIQVVR